MFQTYLILISGFLLLPMSAFQLSIRAKALYFSSKEQSRTMLPKSDPNLFKNKCRKG